MRATGRSDPEPHSSRESSTFTRTSQIVPSSRSRSRSRHNLLAARWKKPALAVLASGLAALSLPQQAWGHTDPVTPPGGDHLVDFGPTPHDCIGGPGVCGLLGRLLPTHLTGIQGGLTWKRAARRPKLLSFSRFSEFSADDIADPEKISTLIERGALTQDRRNNFNAAIRKSFTQFAYGGYNSVQSLTQSVPTRIKADQKIELTQLWDLGHPDALAESHATHVAEIDDADAERNLGAFSGAGFSRGLHYNLYCTSHSTLPDGRVVFAGGHNLNSNNGLHKINVWDPESETWAARTPPCVRAQWNLTATDPYYEGRYLENPLSYLLGCNPHEPLPGSSERTLSEPRDPSDMRYARWYPSQVTLPDGRILILGGSDQDERLEPSITVAGQTLRRPSHHLEDLDAETKRRVVDPSTTGEIRTPQVQSDGRIVDVPVASGFLDGYARYGISDLAFKASKVDQVVPEVYDPRTDTTVALENARMLFPVYPHLTVVRTGPGPDDWQVAAFDGELPSHALNTPSDNPNDAPTNTRARRVRDGISFDAINSNYAGNLHLLDVRSALADPERDRPAEKFWRLVDESEVAHAPLNAGAELITANAKGIVSHKYAVFGSGGRYFGSGTALMAQTGKAEMIDLADDAPRWRKLQPLYQPATFNQAVPLPDGKVIVANGLGIRDADTGETRKSYQEVFSLNLQLYDVNETDPEKQRRTLAKTTVPRGQHGVVTLLPDATVLISGENRERLVLRGDAKVPFGDPDWGVPAAQRFIPPYLLNPDGSRRTRPEITEAPGSISYGRSFTIEIEDSVGVASVSFMRTGWQTHGSHHSDIRYLGLPAVEEGEGRVRVTVPAALRGIAGGDHLLFVIDKNGTPSVGRHVRLHAGS